MIEASINKIIDSSVVDGPGNRTVIFFQGCNFNCEYCHNPETINHCIHCKKCVDVCPVGALQAVDNKVVWQSEKCVDCDSCIKHCPNNSSPKITHITPTALAAKIEKNLPFIRGITCSGGESTLQYKFIEQLFSLTQEMGITNLLDTNGSMDFSKHEELLNVTDGIMLDVKSFNNTIHKEIMGYSNEMVLKNAMFLAKRGKLVEIRTVVIEKYLNNEQTIDEITKLLAPFLVYGDINYKIIKYRPFGVRDEFKRFDTPSNRYMEKLKSIAMENGFKNVVIT